MSNDRLLRKMMAEVRGLAVQVATQSERIDALAEIVANSFAAKEFTAAPCDADIQLVRLLSAFGGARGFMTWELIDAAAQNDARGHLADALAACMVDPTNKKKVGRLLARLEGANCDGLTIQRDGVEGGSVRWRVVSVV